MSPMPTPEYEEHILDHARRRNRGTTDGQTRITDRGRDHNRASRSADVAAPDPRLLSSEPTSTLALAMMRAHRAWALRYAPHLLKEIQR